MASDNEQRLLGKIIRDRDIIPAIERGVTEDWFLDEDNKRVWKFVKKHYSEYGEVPTAVAVKDHYPNYKVLDVQDTIDYLLDTMVAFRRWLLTRDGTAKVVGHLEKKDHEQALLEMERTVAHVNEQGVLGTHEVDITKTTTDRYQDYVDLQNHTFKGIKTGFAKIDEATGGLQGGQLVTIIAPPKTGKAHPYDTPVLTPTGWSTMGSLTVGDEVVGPDGQPTKVIAIHEQGVVPVYKVTLNDGGWTEACAEHLWEVRPHGEKVKVVSTLYIKNRLTRNKRFAYLPTFEGSEYPESDLPIHPWIIGILIGDGSYGRGFLGLTNVDKGVIEQLHSLSPVEVKTKDGVHHSLTTPRGKGNPVRDALKDLGIMGQTGMNKRLPEEFLLWSSQQRKDLLAGLLDSDGCFERNSVTYTSTVPEIAQAVQQLVWSLGGVCTIVKRERQYSFGGNVYPAKDAYTLHMRLPYGNPFGASHRSAKYDNKESVSRSVTRRIDSIEYSRDTQARCITVDREDHLYITKDYIVTHNSMIALQTAINIHNQGYTPMFQSFEMSNKEQEQRHDAMRSHVSHSRLRRGDLVKEEHIRYVEMLNDLEKKDPFHMVDAVNGLTIGALTAKIAQTNPSAVFVDGVYLMIDETTGEMNTPQAITNVTRGLKRLAQKRDIPIVITTQTLLWKMRGGKVTADSIGYSSSFFQDSDVILGLEPIEEDESLRLLKVVASRNCAPSETTLTWRWDIGCFHDEDFATVCKFCKSWEAAR